MKLEKESSGTYIRQRKITFVPTFNNRKDYRKNSFWSERRSTGQENHIIIITPTETGKKDHKWSQIFRIAAEAWLQRPMVVTHTATSCEWCFGSIL